MMYQTTQAHEELRTKVRAFAEAEVKPIAFLLDQENRFPTEAVKKLDELGLMGIPYETKYGGAGHRRKAARAPHEEDEAGHTQEGLPAQDPVRLQRLRL